MVAHTGTTRVRLDPTDALPGGDAPPIPAHLHDRILSELCHPGSSLISVARDNRVTVSQLGLWLSEPETRAKMLAIEKGGYAHTRMAASVCLASTVNVLHTIIEDYTEVRAHAKALLADRERVDTSPHTPYNRRCGVEFKQHPSRSLLPGEAILGSDSYLERRLEARRTESVRRAAHHLYRLSRIVPVDDTKLALALAHSVRVPLVPAERSEAEPVLQAASSDSNRTASVSERTSSPGGTALQSGDASSRVPLVPGERSEPEPVLRDSPRRSVVIANDSEHANQANDANDTKTANSTSSQSVTEPPPRKIPGRMSLEELEAFAKAFDEQTRLDELADQLAEQQNADHAPPITPSRDPPR
jgi:hypothetical protein